MGGRLTWDGGGAGNGRLEVVLNNVGTRQGCSMGSFIFALMIHPYLVQLAEEFKGRVLVLAFADDVNLCGEPADVVEAYKRWKQLYTEELQGSLHIGKFPASSRIVWKCFSSSSPETQSEEYAFNGCCPRFMGLFKGVIGLFKGLHTATKYEEAMNPVKDKKHVLAPILKSKKQIRTVYRTSKLLHCGV